jgi:hypothetical protein
MNPPAPPAKAPIPAPFPPPANPPIPAPTAAEPATIAIGLLRRPAMMAALDDAVRRSFHVNALPAIGRHVIAAHIFAPHHDGPVHTMNVVGRIISILAHRCVHSGLIRGIICVHAKVGGGDDEPAVGVPLLCGIGRGVSRGRRSRVPRIGSTAQRLCSSPFPLLVTPYRQWWITLPYRPAHPIGLPTKTSGTALRSGAVLPAGRRLLGRRDIQSASHGRATGVPARAALRFRAYAGQ